MGNHSPLDKQPQITYDDLHLKRETKFYPYRVTLE